MRSTQLRFALLASLGVLPLACGGTTLGDSREGGQCSSPRTDPATGLVTCDEGYRHRPTSLTCTNVPNSDVDQSSLPRTQPGNALCDADPNACQQFQYGICNGGQLGLGCISGCVSDQDCGTGFICLCSSTTSWGVCEAATCQTNADCDPGFLCSSYTTGYSTGYACQTPQDTCADDRDCPVGQSCQPLVSGSRQCTPRAVAGRPFLVARQQRVAAIVRRSDWLA
jgi:hypothetical protein